MRVPHVLLVSLLATLLTGCSTLGGLLRGPNATIHARLEVWNRTIEPIFLVDRDGRRLDVAACDHAVADEFTLNEVRVRTDEGYIYGFGGGTGQPQYLVFVADPLEAVREELPPAALPPCEGSPQVQPDN